MSLYENLLQILIFFRHPNKNRAKAVNSRLKFGYRMEDVLYRLHNKTLEIVYSWVEGSRIYTETISNWDDGATLSIDEKKKVFTDVVNYVAKKREKPIIVINLDRPSKDLWEQLCSENQSKIKNIEYTSIDQQRQIQRQTYLDILQAGKELVINGVAVRNEKEIDEALNKQYKINTA